MHAAEAIRAHEAPSAAPDVPPAPPARTGQARTAGIPTELEAFFDLGRTLARTASAWTIGETVWRSLACHLPASAFVFFTYDETTDSLVVGYQTGAAAIATDTRIPLGERLSGWVAAARQPIVNSDARLDLDDELRDGSPLRSALAVPICRGDSASTAGVLTFYAEHPDAFTDAHRRIATAAAHALARTSVVAETARADLVGHSRTR
jgi:GAF domain-containing protein